MYDGHKGGRTASFAVFLLLLLQITIVASASPKKNVKFDARGTMKVALSKTAEIAKANAVVPESSVFPPSP